MTALEIIQRGKSNVRNSGVLYPVYEKLFNEAFGFMPECPTCGSINGHKHWSAFEAFANGADPKTLVLNNHSNFNNMSNNTSFEIKNKSKIYFYHFKKEGQDRLFVNRVYGDIMTEEFAVEYLNSAKDDQELYEQRKAEFSKLPAAITGEKVEGENTDLSKLKFDELKAIAVSKQYPEEDYKGINSKKGMVAYLEAKALETPENPTKNAEGSNGDDEDLS